jgi:hypothetical protein
MVVCAILGLALVVSLPMGLTWLADYRYSAACRSFYNAVHLGKINAISGSTFFSVTEIDMGGTPNDFVVTTDYFYFRCNNDPPDINREGDYPVGQGTSVALGGFTNVAPKYAYVNGNVFEVTTTPTVIAGPDKDATDKTKYKAKLRLTLHSDRVQWLTGPGAPIASATGKAWTVAAVKFVPTDVALNLPVYSVKKTGGTVQCEFDPSLYNVDILVNSVSAGVTTPVVFDSKGSPKDLVPYTILIRRMREDGTVSTAGPPFIITVQASGKILSGG